MTLPNKPTRLNAVVKAACFGLAALLAFPQIASAQSWRQNDPSAVVLPSAPSGSSAGSGSRRGGLFRIFRFEPQRRTLPDPNLESAPVINLPPPKDPDAITVVVFGDEFADQMREGLVDRFDGDRLIEADGMSVPGSGVTDLDDFNWNIEALRRLENHTQIGAIVVAIGYSDRRELVEGDRTYRFGSSNWLDAYRNRVSSFALTLIAEGYPVIFVGLPPMADPLLDNDVRLLNQTIEEAVGPTRARFVNVYPGFADVDGNYVRAGPNMAGQVANLRTSEGIFFNRDGREKYAQFVERYIPREGQIGPEPEVSTIVFEGSTLASDGVGPVVLMTSGFSDPTAVLATSAQEVSPEEAVAQDLLLRGAAGTPPPTRADNFVWAEQPDG